MPDGEDEPASVDITSVVYINGEASAGSVVAVRELGDTGRVVTRIGPPDSDVTYHAMVRMKGDGTLVTRLTYVTDTGREPVDCDFTGTWSTDDSAVSVEVPHTCLQFGHFLTREWFQATMYRGPHSDAADSAVVGRGDTPGCAAKAEMAQVHTGDKKFRVDQPWTPQASTATPGPGVTRGPIGRVTGVPGGSSSIRRGRHRQQQGAARLGRRTGPAGECRRAGTRHLGEMLTSEERRHRLARVARSTCSEVRHASPSICPGGGRRLRPPSRRSGPAGCVGGP